MAKYPGEQYTYYSFDSIPEGKTNLYPIKYLNSIPSQGLTLKVNAPIMLHRNLYPVNRLCNGTRFICQQFQSQIIDTEIITGDHQEDTILPFVQFPVQPAFALTINKSQAMSRVYKSCNLNALVNNGIVHVKLQMANLTLDIAKEIAYSKGDECLSEKYINTKAERK
ncbi:6667_t:CDS:2 [Entrophospora sp. SA101]|nr:6667_t:CDS:2 [Entrophospora sp. SA101]